MKVIDIRSELFRMQDKEYASFSSKIIPSVEQEKIIGIRTPQLRAFAKVLFKDKEHESFLLDLPHKYFEENQLHAFLLSLENDFEDCISKTQDFLPQIDNWATCDQFSPKVFKKNKERLLPYIKRWIKSDKTYTVRFAIGMLMQHFLDQDFLPEYALMVAELRSEEYYVNMMRAWYFATALAKQYDCAISFIENKVLDSWTHNKTIQKSIESYRITEKQKKYLRTMRVDD